uniref:C2H2-type domain-containing protein n=1 Tax=Takifugu rubripes TaxID=31033 RepID=A0A674NVW4_TAKRU
MQRPGNVCTQTCLTQQFQRICKKQHANIFKSRWFQIQVASNQKRLEAKSAAKGASAEHWLKYLNACHCSNFSLSFSIRVGVMATGSAKQGAENDPPTPAVPVLSRPYISNKPYQCAICRVSYNHAITLESHMKSVLHQSRCRN